MRTSPRARSRGADCTVGVGADVTVADSLGEWPATILLGEKAGAPLLRVLVDEPSVSSMSTFMRFVHAADWVMDADLGQLLPDCCGDTTYDGVFVDTPYLNIAKSGDQLSKQGFAVLDPLNGISMVLQTTKSADVRATVTVNTDVNEKFSVFTMGTDAASSMLFCDDVADPGKDHLTPCTVVNDGDTFTGVEPDGNSNNN